MRWPNSPLTATTTTSPSCTVFTNDASMPAEPVADSGRVRALSVPHTWRSRSQVSSITRQEGRVEVAEQGQPERGGGLGVGVARAGAEQVAVDEVSHAGEPTEPRRG